MSWKSPEYTIEKFQNVLTLGLSEKTQVRADFEDAMAQQLAQRGLPTTPGNTILLRPESSELDLSYLKNQIRDHKIDAVVVSRLVAVDKKVTYIPGDVYAFPYYYNTFYGYYSAVYRVTYFPEYRREEKKVRIETRLYVIDSGEGKLVWTAITDTFDPNNVHKAIQKLVKVIAKQMERDKVF